MVKEQTIEGNLHDHVMPEIRKIQISDLMVALKKGYDDFLLKPTFIFFLAIIYPVMALFLARFIAGLDVLPYLWPIIAGGTLIAPVAAVGLYEVSRLLEEGRTVSLRNAFNLLNYKSLRYVLVLSVVLGLAWALWLFTAHVIYERSMGGYVPATFAEFFDKVLFTEAGQYLIYVGFSVGALFAAVIFAISVVSFPMIIDRDVTTAEAIATSLRVVLTNPVTMFVWALIIAFSMAVATIPFMFGLAIVLPILGHATWHLYRLAVGD